MDNKKKTSEKTGGRRGSATLEIFGGLLVLLICFVVGFGILYLLGGNDLLCRMDFELLIVLGMLIISILMGAVFTAVYLVKKRKK